MSTLQCVDSGGIIIIRTNSFRAAIVSWLALSIEQKWCLREPVCRGPNVTCSGLHMLEGRGRMSRALGYTCWKDAVECHVLWATHVGRTR